MAEKDQKPRGKDGEAPTVIRKYSNRRLYNTRTGAFVILEDLRRMVVEGEEFTVEDGKEGKDITPSILAQIIAEQESRGESVLPGDLMRQLIAFYDSGATDSFFKYFQDSMNAFTNNLQPFGSYTEMSKRNAELIRKSYQSFFGNLGADAPGRASEEDASSAEMEQRVENSEDGTDEMAALQRQLTKLQEEIDSLRGKRPTRPSKK